MWSLGIDTSNYTTSVAAWNLSTNEVIMQKKILPVEQGRLGLRQSEAVFAHVKQLGELIDLIMRQVDTLYSVGVSVRPRDKEDSYMPCFLVGELVAGSIASSSKVPIYKFSHQAGHIGAVLYNTNNLELIDKDFIAFHLSGGTTESLHVKPGIETPFEIEEIASSSDLYAGQAVDRVGIMLDLPFPSGPHLEELALKSTKSFDTNPFFRDGNPSFSGLENQARKMFAQGDDSADIAKYCLDWIGKVVEIMTEDALKKYPELPIIYSGGVMSNSIIKERITGKFKAYFASPQFSADNAAGAAVLGGLAYKKEAEREDL